MHAPMPHGLRPRLLALPRPTVFSTRATHGACRIKPSAGVIAVLLPTSVSQHPALCLLKAALQVQCLLLAAWPPLECLRLPGLLSRLANLPPMCPPMSATPVSHLATAARPCRRCCSMPLFWLPCMSPLLARLRPVHIRFLQLRPLHWLSPLTCLGAVLCLLRSRNLVIGFECRPLAGFGIPLPWIRAVMSTLLQTAQLSLDLQRPLLGCVLLMGGLLGLTSRGLWPCRRLAPT